METEITEPGVRPPVGQPAVKLHEAAPGLKIDKLSRDYFEQIYLRLELPISNVLWDYDNTLGKTEVRALTNLTMVLNEYLKSIESPTQFEVADVIREYKGKTCEDILKDLDGKRTDTKPRTPPEEIAHVGQYVRQANESKIEVNTFTIPMHEVDRAITDGEETGFLKITVEADSDKILGATMIAEHAGEAINQITLAIAA